VTYIPLRLALPLVAIKDLSADHREARASRYISHEVTAPRAAGSEKLWRHFLV
jgi:hypothetical protein